MYKRGQTWSNAIGRTTELQDRVAQSLLQKPRRYLLKQSTLLRGWDGTAVLGVLQDVGHYGRGVAYRLFGDSLQHEGLHKRNMCKTGRGKARLNLCKRGRDETWAWWETSMVQGSWDHGSPSTWMGIGVVISIFIWCPWANLCARESPT